jgi:hypothetical protein
MILCLKDVMSPKTTGWEMSRQVSRGHQTHVTRCVTGAPISLDSETMLCGLGMSHARYPRQFSADINQRPS